MVWRAISYNSSHFVFLQGKINSVHYIVQVVNPVLLPFLRQEDFFLAGQCTSTHGCCDAMCSFFHPPAVYIQVVAHCVFVISYDCYSVLATGPWKKIVMGLCNHGKTFWHGLDFVFHLPRKLFWYGKFSGSSWIIRHVIIHRKKIHTRNAWPIPNPDFRP